MDESLDIDPVIINYLSELTRSVPHSGRTLLDHLEGVFHLLKSWDNPDYLCLSGLFHSIYSTASFPDIVVNRERRDEVQRLIGSEAESLAYRFCCSRKGIAADVLQNRELALTDRFQNNKSLSLSPSEFSDLMELYVANEFEQLNEVNSYDDAVENLKKITRVFRPSISGSAYRAIMEL